MIAEQRARGRGEGWNKRADGGPPASAERCSRAPFWSCVMAGAVATVLACACGGTQPAPQAPAKTSTPGKVYDEKGQAADCAPPAEQCTPQRPDRELVDKCKLAGYRMIRCGCKDYCMGNVAAPKPHYDATGKAKLCEPTKPECPASDTSAAFQDACTDSGHKLVQCGCEWLCSGKFNKAP